MGNKEEHFAKRLFYLVYFELEKERERERVLFSYWIPKDISENIIFIYFSFAATILSSQTAKRTGLPLYKV